MTSYPKRVWDNILPLSMGDNLPIIYQRYELKYVRD